ncbi:MAG: ChbG/HpnK family deacetylase [Rhodospirillales bacterium]|nr:ChbG/HpnK family deacetylase [Rhodospirillales bacterium]
MTGTEGSPLAERLGVARGVILHVDDLGMCHGGNQAFLELAAAGLVTTGSVMVPCPWFREIAEAGAADPRLDLGVHLTLTSE